MPKFVRKHKDKSGRTRNTNHDSLTADMTRREHNVRKAEINQQNRKMKYDYKTASMKTRAAVQKSTVRSAAGSSMVASGSNSASEQARAESEASQKRRIVYRNGDSETENNQQDGGIGGGGDYYGYKGSDDDF